MHTGVDPRCLENVQQFTAVVVSEWCVTRTEPQRREAKSTTLASHSYNFAGTASQLLIQMSGIESRHHESSVGIMWLETKFLRVAFLEIHNTDGIEPSGNFWLSCDIKEA